MALYWNPRAPLVDNNGAPLLNAAIYYGDPNVDPKANPKAVYLTADFSVAAQNPQRTTDLGVPSQGTIYMNGEYSILVEDSQGGQIHNIPSVFGVSEQLDLNNLGPLTSSGPIEVASAGSALFKANQGTAASSQGGYDWVENNVLKFSMRKQAEADGGALQLINVITGNVLAQWNIDGTTQFFLGSPTANVEVLRFSAFGLQISGLIGVASQVAVLEGEINIGTGEALGQAFGINSVTRTAEGQATVVLSEQNARQFNILPLAEAHRTLADDRLVLTQALGTVAGGAGTVREVRLESWQMLIASGITTPIDGIVSLVAFDSGRITNPV